MRGKTVLALAWWGLVALGGAGAWAQEGDDVEALKKQVAEQQKTIDLLERHVLESEEAAHVAPPNEVAPNVPAEGETKGDVEVVHWNELTVWGHKIKFYGFLRGDLIYHDSAANSTQVLGFVLSEDEDRAPAGGASKKDEDTLTIHPRLTRFGFDLDGKPIEALGGAKPTGKLEMDFYGSGFSESRQALRLRHGYVKLAWGDFSILAGQTGDLISVQYWPTVNPDLAMWGAGNLGDRRPQFRVEYKPSLGPGKLYLGGMIGLTGADDNADFDGAGTLGAGIRDGEASALPTLQFRTAYELPMFEKEKLVLGAFVHGGWEDPARRIGLNKGVFKSWAVGVDFQVPLFKNYLWLKGEAWYGENVDDVRGGIFQGINTVRGIEITAVGGWLELGVRPGTDWFYFVLGYSTDDPKNDDLEAGGRENNQIGYVGTRFTFGPVSFGVDYLYWHTSYKNQVDGRLNRVQAFLQLSF